MSRCTYRFMESPNQNEMQIDQRELNRKKKTFEIAMTPAITLPRAFNFE